MPVHGADDREKNMEIGLAVLFGVCCSVTDCKRRKITLSVLLAGRMYSVRDSYLAGNGECLGNVCSNSSGGMSGKRCNPDCRKGRERRRGNAAGIRVAAGVESMRFNFVHGLSADWCCSWLRNGDRCASSEQ